MIDTKTIAAAIDHTLLKPEASERDVHTIVAEATKHGFASVCVNAVHARYVAQSLDGTSVKTCAVAGFPLGAMKSTVKAIEATAACKDGAQEIDVVAHLPYLIAGNVDAAKAELREVVRGCRDVSREIVVKVIVESAALMKDVSDDEAEARIAGACRAVREAGADFIKTSTGFHAAGGATLQAVRLMVKHADGLKVKASGGIRTREDAVTMLEAGADRLGCSAGVAIVTGGEGTASY